MVHIGCGADVIRQRRHKEELRKEAEAAGIFVGYKNWKPAKNKKYPHYTPARDKDVFNAKKCSHMRSQRRKEEWISRGIFSRGSSIESKSSGSSVTSSRSTGYPIAGSNPSQPSIQRPHSTSKLSDLAATASIPKDSRILLNTLINSLSDQSEVSFTPSPTSSRTSSLAPCNRHFRLKTFLTSYEECNDYDQDVASTERLHEVATSQHHFKQEQSLATPSLTSSRTSSLAPCNRHCRLKTFLASYEECHDYDQNVASIERLHDVVVPQHHFNQEQYLASPTLSSSRNSVSIPLVRPDRAKFSPQLSCECHANVHSLDILDELPSQPHFIKRRQMLCQIGRQNAIRTSIQHHRDNDDRSCCGHKVKSSSCTSDNSGTSVRQIVERKSTYNNVTRKLKYQQRHAVSLESLKSTDKSYLDQGILLDIPEKSHSVSFDDILLNFFPDGVQTFQPKLEGCPNLAKFRSISSLNVNLAPSDELLCSHICKTGLKSCLSCIKDAYHSPELISRRTTCPQHSLTPKTSDSFDYPFSLECKTRKRSTSITSKDQIKTKREDSQMLKILFRSKEHNQKFDEIELCSIPPIKSLHHPIDKRLRSIRSEEKESKLFENSHNNKDFNISPNFALLTLNNNLPEFSNDTTKLEIKALVHSDCNFQSQSTNSNGPTRSTSDCENTGNISKITGCKKLLVKQKSVNQGEQDDDESSKYKNLCSTKCKNKPVTNFQIQRTNSNGPTTSTSENTSNISKITRCKKLLVKQKSVNQGEQDDDESSKYKNFYSAKCRNKPVVTIIEVDVHVESEKCQDYNPLHLLENDFSYYQDFGLPTYLASMEDTSDLL